jgi:hypothetical protein
MLAFGSTVGKEIVRAELVSTCERVVRASPGLAARIANVLKRMGNLTEQQIEAALTDPGILTEFGIVTGNDAQLVTQHNAPHS